MESDKKAEKAVLLKSLGKRIKELRKAQGLSMERLGYKSDMSKETIRAIEYAENDPKYTTLHRIAKALGTRLSKLLDF